jgi:hypothetical protein
MPQAEKANGRSRRTKKMAGTIRFKGRFSDALVFIYKNREKIHFKIPPRPLWQRGVKGALLT